MRKILFFTFLFTSFAQAQTSPPTEGGGRAEATEHSIWSDLNCYMAEDLKSCSAHISSDFSADSDRFYLEYGCNTLKSVDFCIRLGDWWAKRSFDQAKAIYLTHCKAGSASACDRGFNLTDQLPANASGAQIAAAKAASNDFVTLACASTQKDSIAICQKIKARMDARAARVVGKECELRVQFIPETGADLTPQTIPGSYSDTSECFQQCQHMMARLDLAQFEARGVHGLCLKEKQPTGTPLWRFKARAEACDIHSSRAQVSTDEGIFHLPCYCEGDPPAELNKSLEGAGFFTVSYSGKPKRFGTETYVRCLLRIYRSDGFEAKGPKCLADLAKARGILKASAGRDADVQINPKLCLEK